MRHAVASSSDDTMLPGRAVRLACRSGALKGSTAGMALGYAQGNLAVLPKELAGDFLRFCQANPKPCPILGVSEVGSWEIPLARRRSRSPHRHPRLPRLEGRRDDRRGRRRPRLLARRSRRLRHRLFLFLRGRPDRRGHRHPPRRGGRARADVPHQHSLQSGGRLLRADGRVDAAALAQGRDPRGADLVALPGRPRRPRPHRPCRI